MFNFRSLGSGSSGNAYLFETSEGHFLIDAGVGIRKLKSYLLTYGVSINKLEAIFLTHDHSDHSRNVGTIQAVAKKNGMVLPVYATHQVIEGIQANPTISKKPLSNWIRYIDKEKAIQCCGCRLTPFEVPHDSKDNVGYFIEYNGHTLCLVTDVGEVTPCILNYVGRTNQLILESNYDAQMLKSGPYPEYLRQRICGGYGHLCNAEAAQLILNHRERLERVWLCHLSENNNTPQSAKSAVMNLFEQHGLRLADYIDLQVLSRTVPSLLFQL